MRLPGSSRRSLRSTRTRRRGSSARAPAPSDTSMARAASATTAILSERGMSPLPSDRAYLERRSVAGSPPDISPVIVLSRTIIWPSHPLQRESEDLTLDGALDGAGKIGSPADGDLAVHRGAALSEVHRDGREQAARSGVAGPGADDVGGRGAFCR